MPNKKRTIPEAKSGSSQRLRSMLLALATWVFVTLACANTEVSYRVEPGSGNPDRVVAEFGQHLSQSYLRAAQQAEDDRRVD